MRSGSFETNLEDIQQNFVEQGFAVYTLANTDALSELKQLLLKTLRKSTSATADLENYHDYVRDDEEHRTLQYVLFTTIGDSELHKQIIRDNRAFYAAVFGPDLDIQTQPYVRIARPGKHQDNIGFHRDTFYGNSAYEVSSSFALTNTGDKGALMLAPGSQAMGDIEVEQEISAVTTKGSDANKMGFLYAPKKILHPYKLGLRPVPIEFGESVMFGLGVVHGQEVNLSEVTRWAVDFRLKSHFAPISKNLKSGYYSRLWNSGITLAADQYYQASAKEKMLLNQDPGT